MSLPTRTVRCTRNERIAHEVHEVKFTKPEGFAFTPGQYVMMDFPLIGNEADVQPRAYSIASTPGEEGLLFVFKLVQNGRASLWVERRLKPGDAMRIQGPLGVFTLKPFDPSTSLRPSLCKLWPAGRTSSAQGKPDDTRDLLFVCTSTGNAPFRSIIMAALARGDARTMDLIFGVRHEDDLFWTEEFEAIAKEHPNFRFHVILSRPGEGWKGHRGHVQDIIPDVAPDVVKRSVYICGNPAMTGEVKKLCREEWGMGKGQVKVEEYV